MVVKQRFSWPLAQARIFDGFEVVWERLKRVTPYLTAEEFGLLVSEQLDIYAELVPNPDHDLAKGPAPLVPTPPKLVSVRVRTAYDAVYQLMRSVIGTQVVAKVEDEQIDLTVADQVAIARALLPSYVAFRRGETNALLPTHPRPECLQVQSVELVAQH